MLDLEPDSVPARALADPQQFDREQQGRYFWGENEYVVNMSPLYVALVHAAIDLAGEGRRAGAAP